MATKRPNDDDTGAARKRPRTNYGDTIVVLVGTNETSFTVHQDLLRRSSFFFKTAFAGDWLESREGIFRLAETNADAFRTYVDTLYSPSVNLKDLIDEVPPRLLKEETLKAKLKAAAAQRLENTLQLCHMWALGDYLQDHEFQNQALDTLANMRGAWARHAAIMIWVAANTHAVSPLARFLVNAFVPHLKDTPNASAVLDELTDKLPADLLMQLLRARVLPETVEGEAKRCLAYHMHPDGTDRCDGSKVPQGKTSRHK
ncbi:hypothetical protein LTR56_011982 [Elasticomyces elasticus]|nr:hypothetical protein LTR22_018081 [Elasticomyces elasticus]KAK3640186.1 hypothetical protein LTR56_011982 [Elasticomyces elasticus]KAK4913297.1 hypothetical protein LTR49_018370 [Elasticomyces elasticus]KAK5749019.1 hypothetical protein LTS12_020917 [Elasticomyces elasticus]